MTSRLSKITLALMCTALVSGCEWRGLNSLELPGTHGRGDGAYEVIIEMPDVTTLERNSRVRTGDVTIGRVADLQLATGTRW